MKAQSTKMNDAIEYLISTDLKLIRKHLRSMQDAYLLQKDEEMEYPKKQVHDTFYVLDVSLKSLQELKQIQK